MNLIKALVTLLCFSAAVSVQAAPAKKQKSASEQLAQATANTVNRWGTVGGMVTWMAKFNTVEDSAKIKSFYEKNAVDLTQKFPKMSVKGNKAYFDKNNYVTYNGKTITANGFKFPASVQPLSVRLIEITNKISKKQASLVDLLMPQAYANFPLMEAAIGAIGGVAVGAGYAYFTGSDPVESMAVAGVIGLSLGTACGYFCDDIGNWLTSGGSGGGQAHCNAYGQLVISNGNGERPLTREEASMQYGVTGCDQNSINQFNNVQPPNSNFSGPTGPPNGAQPFSGTVQ